MSGELIWSYVVLVVTSWFQILQEYRLHSPDLTPADAPTKSFLGRRDMSTAALKTVTSGSFEAFEGVACRCDDAGAIHTADVSLTSPTNGNSSKSVPTLLFRLALALRRCGDAVEADALFRKSHRLLLDQYVNERLGLAR